MVSCRPTKKGDIVEVETADTVLFPEGVASWGCAAVVSCWHHRAHPSPFARTRLPHRRSAGGGQPDDHGTLGGFPVVRVRRKGGSCGLHVVVVPGVAVLTPSAAPVACAAPDALQATK